MPGLPTTMIFCPRCPVARLLFAAAFLPASLPAQPLVNDRYTVEAAADGAVRLTAKDAGTWLFRGDFAVLVATADPKPAMRPGNIARVSYNIVTWQTPKAPAGAAFKAAKRSAAQAGDGFDDRILAGDTQQRTADLFAAAPVAHLRAVTVGRRGDALEFVLPPHDQFAVTARLTLPPGDAEPELTFTLTPRTASSGSSIASRG
jgi:hypothetical protein